MNERTKQTIERLKQMGVSSQVLEGLEREVNANTNIDTFIANKGILDSEHYTRFIADKEQEYADKAKAVQELASLQDALKVNPDLLKSAKDRIEELQGFLIREHNYTPEEVTSLSAELITDLDTTIKNLESSKMITNPSNIPNTNNDGDRKGEEMTLEELQKQGVATRNDLANVAFGNLAHSIKINNILAKVQRLGIDIDDAKIDAFAARLEKELTPTKNIEAIADEHFGISAKQAEINKNNQDAEINRRVNEEVANKLKEQGLTLPRQVNIKTPGNVFDRSRNSKSTQQTADDNGAGKVNTKTDNGFGKTVVGGVEVPNNKYGDPEIYRGRLGSTAARIATHVNKYTDSLNEAIEQNHGRLD